MPRPPRPALLNLATLLSLVCFVAVIAVRLLDSDAGPGHTIYVYRPDPGTSGPRTWVESPHGVAYAYFGDHVRVHLVPALIVTGALPAARLVAWRLGRAAPARRRERTLLGLCPGCGYDLRGTPGRCPECGTVPSGANGNAETPRRRDAEKTPFNGGAE